MTLRRKDAQHAVAQLLQGANAVLAGHALHHDLLALRLDYQPVVDTSLLFSYRCAPLPGLTARQISPVLLFESHGWWSGGASVAPQSGCPATRGCVATMVDRQAADAQCWKLLDKKLALLRRLG